MVASILSSLTSKPIVSFYNELNGLQLWSDAKSVEVEITSSSDNANVPLSAIQVSDSAVSSQLLASDISTGKILTPTHLKATILTDNLSLIENVRTTFADTSITLQITSKSIIAKHMAMISVELEQSSEMLSATRISILFEQAIVGVIPAFKPAQSSDADNFGISLQSLPTVGSTLSTIQTRVGSIIDSTGTAVTGLYNKFATSIGL